jgi:hypothetical protein
LKTEFYEYEPGHNKLIKEVEGVLIPHLPRDASVEIDDYVYTVLNYALIIHGDEVTANVLLK